jgi:hypothetical protein
MEISAPKILEDLVAQAERAGASDIHLQMHDGAAQVSFRLDGLMTDAAPLSAEVADRVFGRRMAALSGVKSIPITISASPLTRRSRVKKSCFGSSRRREPKSWRSWSFPPPPSPN